MAKLVYSPDAASVVYTTPAYGSAAWTLPDASLATAMSPCETGALAGPT